MQMVARLRMAQTQNKCKTAQAAEHDKEGIEQGDLGGNHHGAP